ncbi:MAG: TetR/AcrR family transcriptional regulator [Solirubrobacteraceae bacterium]
MQPGDGTAERTFIENARRAQIIDAAIDTLAEVGYARASLGRIAERIGISRALISYHFAGKEELFTEIVRGVLEQSRAYMGPRVMAETSGPAMLHAYIESNLVFIREHRNALIAIVEIARTRVAAETPPLLANHNPDQAVQVLAQLLSRFQEAGDFRADFDPRLMAITIRAAIDTVAPRLARDPDFDIDEYRQQIATVFQLATRVDE